MVVVLLIEREKLSHLEPFNAGDIQTILNNANIPPNQEWGGVISDDEKVLLVYLDPPAPIGLVASALGISAKDITQLREFGNKGKGVYLIYEGINKKGRHEKIEVIRE